MSSGALRSLCNIPPCHELEERLDRVYGRHKHAEDNRQNWSSIAVYHGGSDHRPDTNEEIKKTVQVIEEFQQHDTGASALVSQQMGEDDVDMEQTTDNPYGRPRDERHPEGTRSTRVDAAAVQNKRTDDGDEFQQSR